MTNFYFEVLNAAEVIFHKLIATLFALFSLFNFNAKCV